MFTISPSYTLRETPLRLDEPYSDNSKLSMLGNIRELSNFIQSRCSIRARAVNLSMIPLAMLPAGLQDIAVIGEAQELSANDEVNADDCIRKL